VSGRIQQSLAYWCLHDTEWRWDIHRICETACKLGCHAVELVPPEEWDVVRSYGLTMALAHNGMPAPVFVKGLNNLRYHGEVIARTRETIDRCAEAGVPNVIAFTGYKWRDAEDAESGAIPKSEATENVTRGLRELAEYGAPRGVNVCLEHLNTRDEGMKGHPGYHGDDVDWCAALGAAAGAKLLFDVYHVAIMQGDVIRRIRTYGDLIGHVHVAGVPGRAELDGRQEVNYPAVMQALLEVGYGGYVGQEFIPTREPEEALKQAVDWCDV
jgi:hydroxypyruvate isomerase